MPCIQSPVHETAAPPPAVGAAATYLPSDLRPAERLRRHGPCALDEMEILALVGGCSQAVAGRLLLEFGSFCAVAAASEEAVQRCATRRTALRLGLFREAARRLAACAVSGRPLISSSSALLTYVRTMTGGGPREVFRVLFLDKRNRLIADEEMGRGTVDHAPVYPREVVRRALELAACSMILVHNHPSGDPTPSAADVEMTRQIVDAARMLGLTVHDHLVVGDASTASLKTLGLM